MQLLLLHCVDRLYFRLLLSGHPTNFFKSFNNRMTKNTAFVPNDDSIPCRATVIIYSATSLFKTLLERKGKKKQMTSFTLCLFVTEDSFLRVFLRSTPTRPLYINVRTEQYHQKCSVRHRSVVLFISGGVVREKEILRNISPFSPFLFFIRLSFMYMLYCCWRKTTSEDAFIIRDWSMMSGSGSKCKNLDIG